MKPLIARNPLVRFGKSLVYYGLAVPVLFTAAKLFLGLQIRGRQQLKSLKGKGFVMVCSHNHYLDCASQGLLFFPCRAVFTSQEPVFDRFIIGPLVRLVNSVPVPSKSSGMKRFLEELSTAVRNGRVVAMYPEGELKPYCKELRPFRDGAFMIAAMADAPVVPAVVTFREPRGLWRLVKRKPLLTVTAGEPIYPCAENSPRREARRLCTQVRKSMQAIMDSQRPLGTVKTELPAVCENQRTA